MVKAPRWPAAVTLPLQCCHSKSDWHSQSDSSLPSHMSTVASFQMDRLTLSHISATLWIHHTSTERRTYERLQKLQGCYKRKKLHFMKMTESGYKIYYTAGGNLWKVKMKSLRLWQSRWVSHCCSSHLPTHTHTHTSTHTNLALQVHNHSKSPTDTCACTCSNTQIWKYAQMDYDLNTHTLTHTHTHTVCLAHSRGTTGGLLATFTLSSRAPE